MKRAFVLGGGGSKGAYEIGVWKALDELGMHFDIVTGTSIGALIGVLYVQGDFERAVALWENLNVDDVMANGMNLDFDIELLRSQKDRLPKFMEGFIKNKGADITPFIKILDTLFQADKFFNSPIDYGCMCVNVSKLSPSPIKKAEMTKENAKDYLLASASCYPAFPMKEINGDNYIDGGYYDNVPVKLAREMGADEIVAIDLKSIGQKQIKTPQKDTIYIEPMVPLGSFLLFDQTRMQRNGQLGYQDAMKKFGAYIGTIYTFSLLEENDISLLEKNLENAFYHIPVHILSGDEVEIAKKAIEHQLRKGLQPYQGYQHPYLMVIEKIAYHFGLDDIGIQSLHSFLKAIYDTVKAIELPEHDLKTNMKSMIGMLKKGGEKERIYYLYRYLCTEHYAPHELKLASVVLNESFIMAYALYILMKMNELKQ